MKKSGPKKGFTLIELIIVIVLLGILAATALPRFVDFSSDARVSRLQTIGVNLQAALTLGQNKWRAEGSSGNTVSINGVDVAVNSIGCPIPMAGLNTSNKASLTTAMLDTFWTRMMGSALPSGFTASNSSGNNWYQYSDPIVTNGTCKFRVKYDTDANMCTVVNITSGC